MKLEHDVYRPAVRLGLVVTCLLILPLLAMQVTDEVAWGPMDFVVAGVLLFGTGLLYQAAARKAGRNVQRVAVGVALGAALLLVWSNIAVGLIGSEDDPANLMYLVVLAVGMAGATLARLRPRGMARAMWAMAAAQALVMTVALVLGLGAPASGAAEIIWVNALFIALFAASASLFRESARVAAEGRAA